MKQDVHDFKLKLLKIIDATPEVKLFHVEYPKDTDLNYLPGQFFMVSIVDDEVKAARAYSIATSNENKDYLEIGFNKVGVLTTRFFELKEGAILSFKGPFGKFFFDDETDGKKDVLLIAAGTGITPMMSVIRHCDAAKLPCKVNLLYTVKRPNLIIYKDELEERKRSNARFSHTITITRPEEGDDWQGRTGRFDQQELKKNVENPENTVVFICGPREFVYAMIKELGELGVKKDQIKTDLWGH